MVQGLCAHQPSLRAHQPCVSVPISPPPRQHLSFVWWITAVLSGCAVSPPWASDLPFLQDWWWHWASLRVSWPFVHLFSRLSVRSFALFKTRLSVCSLLSCNSSLYFWDVNSLLDMSYDLQSSPPSLSVFSSRSLRVLALTLGLCSIWVNFWIWCGGSVAFRFVGTQFPSTIVGSTVVSPLIAFAPLLTISHCEWKFSQTDSRALISIYPVLVLLCLGHCSFEVSVELCLDFVFCFQNSEHSWLSDLRASFSVCAQSRRAFSGICQICRLLVGRATSAALSRLIHEHGMSFQASLISLYCFSIYYRPHFHFDLYCCFSSVCFGFSCFFSSFLRRQLRSLAWDLSSFPL